MNEDYQYNKLLIYISRNVGEGLLWENKTFWFLSVCPSISLFRVNCRKKHHICLKLGNHAREVTGFSYIIFCYIWLIRLEHTRHLILHHNAFLWQFRRFSKFYKYYLKKISM